MTTRLAYYFGPFRFDGGALLLHDTLVQLRQSDAKALHLLVANAKTLVTRDAIKAQISPKGDRGSVDQCVTRLRKALKHGPWCGGREGEDYVATINGAGYMFMKDVNVMREGSPQSLCRLGVLSWNYREREQLFGARRCFNEALKRDPGLPDAHAGLASCYAILGSYYWLAPCDGSVLARNSAEDALSMDEDLPEGHATLAFVDSLYEHRWDAARLGFERALKRKPDHGVSHHWLALHHAATNDLPEAQREIDAAVRCHPSRSIAVHAATIRYWAGQYEEAEALALYALDLHDDFYYAHYQLGLIHEAQGCLEKAVDDQRNAIARYKGESPVLTAALERTEVLLRKRDKLACSTVGHQARGGRAGDALFHRAAAYAALGDKDTAFEYLDAAVGAKEVWVSFAAVDPRIASLRSDSRFGALLARMDLTRFVH